MAVEGDEACIRGPGDRQREDAGRIGNRKAQADEGPGRCIRHAIHLPVRGGDGAQRAPPRGIARHRKGKKPAIRAKPEIPDVQGDVSVKTGILRLLHDQQAGHPARYLFEGVAMGMIPVGSGIARGEGIAIRLPHADGQLRQIGHAVLIIGHALAVPMHGCHFFQRVFDHDHGRLALFHAQDGGRAVGGKAHHSGGGLARLQGVVQR